jgi:hypothetical protein
MEFARLTHKDGKNSDTRQFLVEQGIGCTVSLPLSVLPVPSQLHSEQHAIKG